MSNSGVRIKAEALREVAFSSITSSYAQLTPDFTHTIKLAVITNTTDADIYVSFDGVDPHMRVIKNSQRIFDLKTNDFFLQNPDKIYIKYVTAPSLGDFIFEAYYG